MAPADGPQQCRPRLLWRVSSAAPSKLSSDGASFGLWVLASSSVWIRRHLPWHRPPAAAVAGKSGEQGDPQGFLCILSFFKGLLCKFGWDNCALHRLRVCASFYNVLYGSLLVV